MPSHIPIFLTCFWDLRQLGYTIFGPMSSIISAAYCRTCVQLSMVSGHCIHSYLPRLAYGTSIAVRHGYTIRINICSFAHMLISWGHKLYAV